jgi:hypothetical protein
MSPINQIKPFPLWLGHAGSGRDFRPALAAGIEAVVQLAAEEPALQPPRDLIYCRFPLLDGGDNPPDRLRLTIATVVELLGAPTPTLLCCSFGRSRSPPIAAAALALLQKTPLETCLQYVGEQYRTDVSPGLWQDIVTVMRDSQREVTSDQ